MYENGHPVVRDIPSKEDVINSLHNHQVPSSQTTRFSQNNRNSSTHPPNSRILTAGSQIIKKESHPSPSKSKLPPSSPILEEQEKKKKNREHSHHRHHHHRHHRSKSPIDIHSSIIPHPPQHQQPPQQHQQLQLQQYHNHSPPQPPVSRYSNPYSYPVYPPRQSYSNNPYYSGGGVGGNGIINPLHPMHQPPPPAAAAAIPPNIMPYNNPYLPYQYPIQPPQPPPPPPQPPITYSNPNNLDKELFSQLKDMLTQQQELQTTKLINQQLTREIENERQQNQLNLLLEQKRLVEQQRNEMNEKINDLKSFVKEQIQDKPLRFQGNNGGNNNNQFGDDLIIPYHPLPSLPPTPPQPPKQLLQPPPPAAATTTTLQSQYYPQQPQPQYQQPQQYPLQPMPQPFMPFQPTQQPQQNQQQQQQQQQQQPLPSVVTNPPVVPGPTPVKSLEDFKFPHNNPFLNSDKWKKKNNNKSNNNNEENNNNFNNNNNNQQQQQVQNIPTFQPVKNETPQPIDRVEYVANIRISHMISNNQSENPICEIRVVRHNNYDNPKDIFICEGTHCKDGKYVWNQGTRGILFVSNDYNTMLIRVLDGDYNLLYWAAVPIFNIDNNKIDALDATITLPLYDPPDWAAGSSQKEISKDNAVIEFTVSKAELDIQQDLIDQMKEPFIPYHRCFDYHEIFQETDGADIYIDGLRSLPDCATVTRIFALIASDDNTIITKADKNEMCDLDELRYDPYFNIKLAYRPENLNGSATLIIRVDTLEENTKERKSIGYAFFPLFVKSESDYSQPNADDKNFILRTGNYQVRIHAINFKFRKQSVRPDEEPILSSGILPCSTITLRIRNANKKKDNTRCYYFEEYEKHGFSIEKRLDYNHSCYDTRMCDEQGFENATYFARKKRPNLKLSESYDKMLDEETLTKLNYNKESISEHLAIMLNDKPQELINPSLIVGGYDEFTCQICVESVFGYDRKYALKVSHILIPYCAEYFKSKACRHEMKYTKKSNWDSRIGAICFDIDSVDNHKLTYDQKATIIFQLYTVTDNGKVDEIGWSALPVFYENNKSLLFGKYLAAVFKEDFGYDIVNEFNSLSFDEVMKKHIKKCKGISILVKINDMLLSGFVNANNYPIDNRYLPNDGSKDPYKKWLNEIPQDGNSRKSIYTTIIPKSYGTDIDSYERMTNEAMEKHLGINETAYQ